MSTSISAVPRTLWALALGLALANGAAAWVAERTTVRQGLAAEAAAAAGVLAAGWAGAPTAADWKAAHKKLVERPGFRALVALDGAGRAPGAPGGLVVVGLDAAPVRAAEAGALAWALRVAAAWAIALLGVAWAFHGWWSRRVALLVAGAAGSEPGAPRAAARAGVFELDGLADVFTVMGAVQHDAEVRRARARFAAERDRGEPEMVEAFAAELAAPLAAEVGGRRVASGATAGAEGAFSVVVETPRGGSALVARLRVGGGLKGAVEAEGARRLALALLQRDEPPQAVWEAVSRLWPVEAWDLATWAPGGAARARSTLAAGDALPAPRGGQAGALVLGTFAAATLRDMEAYAARLSGLSATALRDDLLELVAASEPGALILVM